MTNNKRKNILITDKMQFNITQFQKCTGKLDEFQFYGGKRIIFSKNVMKWWQSVILLLFLRRHDGKTKNMALGCSCSFITHLGNKLYLNEGGA